MGSERISMYISSVLYSAYNIFVKLHLLLMQASEDMRSVLQQLLQDEVDKASKQQGALATFEFALLESAQVH